MTEDRRVASDPSRTAETTATQRAGERHMPPERRLLDDPYARHFVGRRAYRALIRFGPLARFGLRQLDKRFPGLHVTIMMRARYADHVIETNDELEQVVLMGAGFDSSAWRHAERGLAFFEVDAPTTQAAKRELMRRAGLESPATLVACDFEVDEPGPLLRDAGLDPQKRTLTIWLGVSYYLTREAFRGALETVAGYTAPGGLLVLDYMDPDVIDGTTTDPGALRAREWVEKRGEPYVLGFTRDELASELARAGFDLTEHLRMPELAERLGPPAGVWCTTNDWIAVALSARRSGETGSS